VDFENVIVVPGGKPIMFFAMLALVNPGDEVIYPDPGFPIYRSCIKFAGGVPVPMPILEENDFRVDVEDLKALVTDKTKMIILNNPANPTGGIFTKEDIKNIADFLKDKDIFVLSDEVYDRIVFNDEIISIASIPHMKNKTIILDSFSKTYAMPGWRIGYGVANKDIINQIEL
jgi:aspartate/methionine/tyrosine aminotransferase